MNLDAFTIAGFILSFTVPVAAAVWFIVTHPKKKKQIIQTGIITAVIVIILSGVVFSTNYLLSSGKNMPEVSATKQSTTPTLVKDGTSQEVNKALDCQPSSPIEFIVVTITVLHNNTQLLLNIQNTINSEQSVSNGNGDTLIRLQAVDGTQQYDAFGFQFAKLPPLKTLMQTVTFSFVPFSKTTYELHTRFHVGGGVVNCTPIQLIFP